MKIVDLKSLTCRTPIVLITITFILSNQPTFVVQIRSGSREFKSYWISDISLTVNDLTISWYPKTLLAILCGLWP